MKTKKMKLDEAEQQLVAAFRKMRKDVGYDVDKHYGSAVLVVCRSHMKIVHDTVLMPLNVHGMMIGESYKDPRAEAWQRLSVGREAMKFTNQIITEAEQKMEELGIAKSPQASVPMDASLEEMQAEVDQYLAKVRKHKGEANGEDAA